MKVILLQDVAKIGKKYEIKNIADGYALNFLLPKKLARLADAGSLKEIEILKKKNKEGQEKTLENIKALKDLSITITANANEDGVLFAGIDAQAVSEALKDHKAININSDLINLEKPIKKIGEYEIEIGKNNPKTSLRINIINGEKD